MPDTESKPTDKPKKPRDVNPIVIQRREKDFWIDVNMENADLMDAAGARKWIETSGTDGSTYRITRVIATITLKEETVKTRKLIES